MDTGPLWLAAAHEEAVFRGYPFQRLVESLTPVGAIAVASALFGLAHFGNPHRTWISTANTMLVGIPFAIALPRAALRCAALRCAALRCAAPSITGKLRWCERLSTTSIFKLAQHPSSTFAPVSVRHAAAMPR